MAELAAMTEKMTLEKKNKRRAAKASKDVDMDDDKAPKIQIKSKAIKKTQREANRFKKSRRQLLH